MAIVTRIAAVSYLNTIPFIYGIGHEGSLDAELLKAPPAECARNFIEGRADIALIPSAAVQGLKSAEIVSDYCLGASGPVRSVTLMSNTPLSGVRRIFLDAHSRTSVQLCGWLAANRWRIAPEWLPLTDYSNLAYRASEGDAFLLIGDKVFEHEGEFAFTLDLAAEWIAATGLPFAFAVWVARKGTPYEVIDALQRSLSFGVERIYEAIVEGGYGERSYAYEYLTRNIDFLFDEQKHKALKKFWSEGLKVAPRVNPG
ncbi:MAG: menaquinone biosynthesis protein [Alistipes sp.]|nr:menaquinone biosynthesis protein [Alistipes sp.]